MTCLLYLLPAATDAFSDRYGYRKMLFVSFIILAPFYFMLGMAKDFWSFFAVFFVIAIGAAIYKPLVTATISHICDDSNRSLGFGFNYMLVNVGATIGVFAASQVRAIS